MSHSPRGNEKEEYRYDPKTLNKYKEVVSTMPRRECCWVDDLYQYEGFWYNLVSLEGMLSAQDHFKPQPNDLILSCVPKAGTTWLKALSFAIMKRSHVDESTNPLLTRSVHDLVPFLEFDLLSNPRKMGFNIPIVATHIAYTSLPNSIINSSCKIIYLCRDPKDIFVSLWHFNPNFRPNDVEASAKEDLHLEDALESFCEGLSLFGPYWDHVFGYWTASLQSPEKILFVKYEDLQNDSIYWVKKMAMFTGCPFSLEEEEKGVVQKIINLCSFENLSSLKVNKSGTVQFGANALVVNNSFFFRKGQVGDWKNYLTPDMAKRLNQMTEQKLKGSGLTFNDSSNA